MVFVLNKIPFLWENLKERNKKEWETRKKLWQSRDHNQPEQRDIHNTKIVTQKNNIIVDRIKMFSLTNWFILKVLCIMMRAWEEKNIINYQIIRLSNNDEMKVYQNSSKINFKRIMRTMRRSGENSSIMRTGIIFLALFGLTFALGE